MRSRAHQFFALVVTLLVVGTAIASCSRGATVDEVTVTAGSATVTLPQALVCLAPVGSDELTCTGGETDDDAPHLALAPGTPVEVAVPTEVAATPWVIVFTSVAADGEIRSDRTAVFTPDEQFSYRVQPEVGAQLTRLEVQSLIAAPTSDGGIEFPAVGTWVVVIDPVGAAVD